MAESTLLEEWLTWAFSPTMSAIIITALVSLSLPVLIHWYLYRKAGAKEVPCFLLVGPSGVGKTSLLTLFANGAASTTHTSQEPQTALCHLPAGTASREDRYRSEHDPSSSRTSSSRPSFALLDTPGHGKLRHHASTAVHSRTALRGIVFVVDSAAASSAASLTETAEYLHDLLLLLQKRHTQGTTSKGPAELPLLVAANKQDLFTSLPAPLLAAKLEEEIGRVRLHRSKGLLDSGVGMLDQDLGTAGEEEERNWLGEFGSNRFEFVQMRESGVEVSVLPGNVRGGEGEEAGRVDEWWAWIAENL